MNAKSPLSNTEICYTGRRTGIMVSGSAVYRESNTIHVLYNKSLVVPG